MQTEETKKRNVWVSVILTIFGLGLPLVYCGNLKAGIFVLLAEAVISFLGGMILYLIPTFSTFLTFFTVSFAIFVILLIFNIYYTKKANRLHYNWLNNTWLWIVAVFVLSIIVSTGSSIVEERLFWKIYSIPATSLEDTILIGDQIIATKVNKPEDYKIGDLVIFEYRGNPKIGRTNKGTDYIKRVIAREGQRVKIVNKEVYVDDELFVFPPTSKIDSSDTLAYYKTDSVWGPQNRDNMPEVIVPSGKIFVMGDNRDNSVDSRYFGFVDEKDVKGKAQFVYFSWDSENSRIRWERIGLRVN